MPGIFILIGGMLFAIIGTRLLNCVVRPHLSADSGWKINWVQAGCLENVVIISIVSKEALFRYTIRSGRKLKSPALIANAWHHRSDALSSIPGLSIHSYGKSPETPHNLSSAYNML